ncbi:MAG: hypothetical protein ABFC77_07895 [Thermoguttaceae bacterium]
MDDSLRRMSEYFGPGYRVLNVRFARLDTEQDVDEAIGEPSRSAGASATISTSWELTTTHRSATRRWKHPVPGQPGLSGLGVFPTRRRRRRSASARKASFHLQQTPLFLAAAGIALSLVLAMTLPAQRTRRETALGSTSPPAWIGGDHPSGKADPVLFSAVCDRWEYAPLSNPSW